MAWNRIISVNYTKDLILQITFDDSVSGEIDFSKIANQGVLMSLQDSSFFRKFNIVRNGRAIEWEGGLDICADSIYNQIVHKSLI